MLGRIMFGCLLAVSLFYSQPASAHMAGFIRPMRINAVYSVRYFGHYNLTRTSESLYALYRSYSYFGAIACGYYTWATFIEAHGQSYDGFHKRMQNGYGRYGCLNESSFR